MAVAGRIGQGVQGGGGGCLRRGRDSVPHPSACVPSVCACKSVVRACVHCDFVHATLRVIVRTACTHAVFLSGGGACGSGGDDSGEGGSGGGESGEGSSRSQAGMGGRGGKTTRGGDSEVGRKNASEGSCGT
eukprot:SAG11_NODE_867_length_6831_cov_5.720737_6_plen_132_part_00